MLSEQEIRKLRERIDRALTDHGAGALDPKLYEGDTTYLHGALAAIDAVLAGKPGTSDVEVLLDGAMDPEPTP